MSEKKGQRGHDMLVKVSTSFSWGGGGFGGLLSLQQVGNLNFICIIFFSSYLPTLVKEGLVPGVPS